MFGLVIVAIRSSICMCVRHRAGVFSLVYFRCFYFFSLHTSEDTTNLLILPLPTYILPKSPSQQQRSVAAPVLSFLCRPTTDATCAGGTNNRQRQQAGTPAEHKTHKQQQPFRPGSKSRQSAAQACVFASQTAAALCTEILRSEIGEETDEVNLTRVVKLLTDTRTEEPGNNVSLG